VAAARAAYVAGFDATSNLAAGKLYGVPTAGTASHAFVLAHRSEREAFEAQVRTQDRAPRCSSTPLTRGRYRTSPGRGGARSGPIRIDSGDLGNSTRRSRKLLDQRGATNVKITVTGDLDEFAIAECWRTTPGRLFGVGTKLVTGYMPPGFVFKLVAIEDATTMRPVANVRSVSYRAAEPKTPTDSSSTTSR